MDPSIEELAERITDEDVKTWIDNASYQDLLTVWRFAKAGDRRFQSDNGRYFAAVMNMKAGKLSHEKRVAISKSIGWTMPKELE